MNSDPIVVVGGGIAGLTAAYQLKKAGQPVLVLDRNNYPGGRMATVDWEGFRIDIGAKFITSADQTLKDMVDELGLSDQLTRREEGLTITIYRNGQTHSANFLSIPSYLGWSGVSLKARLAMIKLFPHFLKMGRLENPFHLEQAGIPDVDETYEEFFKKHINEEMFEYWAIPMYETMCAYTGKDVSRKAFLAMLMGYMNSDSVSFKNGVGTLTERLSESVAVELNSLVTSIKPSEDNSGADVTYTSKGVKKELHASRVIVAVPGNHVLDLFDEPHPAWKEFFPNVAYSTGAMHYHVAETDFQPEVRSLFIPRNSNSPINTIQFESFKDGRWLILTDPSVYTFSMEDDPDLLAAQAQDAVAEIFPAVKGTFVNHRIFKWRDLVPAFRPGYLDAVSAFWAGAHENPVYFCGDYFAGPSTGAASYTGEECALRVLESLSSK
jgi:protoporphyrinogen/coproporphyrinogen III oxidase